ncbi:hypothetical protein PRVXT_000400 [Proteinivorax tanatarense]|uniref:Uncharacterized protein n=1 Tax=Proteinivorax tanatarense TaxID=1260629 RepID=A0AAU7VN32_9FIRM
MPLISAGNELPATVVYGGAFSVTVFPGYDSVLDKFMKDNSVSRDIRGYREKSPVEGNSFSVV